MTSPIDVAMNRLSELKAEMTELETFIKVYYRLYPQEKLSSLLPNGPVTCPPATLVDKSVERYSAFGPRGPRKMMSDTPSEASFVNAPTQPDAREKLRNAREVFGDLFDRLIREAGRPLTRGEILERIAELPDTPPLNSGDNSKYLGTLLWRNRHRFRNLPGHGYWIKDQSYAPAGYDPSTDTEEKVSLEAEDNVQSLVAEHDALVAEIDEHNRRYHAEDAPTISDAEYQKLQMRKQAIENSLPGVL